KWIWRGVLGFYNTMVMFIGGMAIRGITFTFGPQYGLISVITLVFYVVTILLLIKKKKIILGLFT
ncbi:hypothetical protein J4G37_46685, partial [Microvirga sp. 3-52]|nr:hypothetical protein [Microvirga sp. 3-52]